MRDYEKIHATIMRGGTSKGVYILQNELPHDPLTRDKVILSIYGSPDSRQIDGLGGASPLTSKFAMVRISNRADADVEYTFGQVSVNQEHIDYSINCGNILSGVGPFAIDHGLVQVNEPLTMVRIYNVNTKKIIVAEVPVKNGKAKIDGDFHINGVPGTGAKIMLNFLDAAGARTGKLLPTGNAKDEIRLGNGEVLDISIVDAANLCVFVKAADIGLSGSELPQDLTIKNKERLEEIRATIAVNLGFANTKEEASLQSPASPKIIYVGSKHSYTSLEGIQVEEKDIGFLSRAISMGTLHQAYPVTGGICTAVASLIKGTVVQETCDIEVSDEQNIVNKTIRFGHPSGIIEFEVEIDYLEGTPKLNYAAVARTSRTLMEGHVYIPSDVYWGSSVV
ncbi:PrpF domain-containing protein [Alkalihalophilus lindianensis]|uniref:PrpF domain-containing protein n=1 Tax=Alkalihalophilus lindianensis TaxID=1630542 RepID=A0ABU3XE08_9BACI|nr:PrpF domain-containing protein [Alkalihalophilus lindianensis]MDV2686124.1 PrpF domain-containing protein [Alkalihalophilus lindianensis]